MVIEGVVVVIGVIIRDENWETTSQDYTFARFLRSKRMAVWDYVDDIAKVRSHSIDVRTELFLT